MRNEEKNPCPSVNVNTYLRNQRLFVVHFFTPQGAERKCSLHPVSTDIGLYRSDHSFANENFSGSHSGISEQGGLRHIERKDRGVLCISW